MGFFKRLGKFIKSALTFEKAHLKHIINLVKKNPERLLIGAGPDPFSTKLWNKILGTNYEPIVNQFGGATEAAYEYAESKGIDTSAGRTMQGVAQVIASFYAGEFGMSKLGGGAAGGATSAPATGGSATGVGAPAAISANPAPAAGAFRSAGEAVASAAGDAITSGASTVAQNSGIMSKAGGLFKNIGTKAGKIFKNVGQFAKNNPELTGSVLSAAGGALGEQNPDLEVLKYRGSNYAGTDPGRAYKSFGGRPIGGGQQDDGGQQGLPAGASSDTRYGGYEYQYDPQQGRIVRVPLT